MSACNWFSTSHQSSIPVRAPVCLQSACLVLLRGAGKRLQHTLKQPPRTLLAKSVFSQGAWGSARLSLKGHWVCLHLQEDIQKLWWITKWSHLCIKWFLDKDWDTMRLSSLSSPQTNDVQAALSYKSLDLQANISSLRFSFTKQIFIGRSERKVHHVWDTHKALLPSVEFGAAAEPNTERHRPSPWQTITTSSPISCV